MYRIVIQSKAYLPEVHKVYGLIPAMVHANIAQAIIGRGGFVEVIKAVK